LIWHLKSMGMEYEVLPEMVDEVLQGSTLLANPKKFDREKIKWLLESVR
jgi:alcohol dehydrogenase class IV